jgi:hypothetical protein
MFAPIVLAAALSAASPSPQPSAAPALKTIASVRSSSRCAEIITHANSAIGAALSNDAVLSRTITFLRMTNLDDGNAIHRRNSMNALGDLAKTLMQQARSGDDEVKRLRALAKQSKDQQQAKDLKDFADELGGALWRQQKVARDLNGLLAYEDMKDMSTWSDSDKQMNRANFGIDDPQSGQVPTDLPHGTNSQGYTPQFPPFIGHDPNDPTATDYARAAAADFQGRIPDIVLNERQAATHVDGAISGC